MMYVGRYLTAKISEYPNHEIECTLSDIIEESVPAKYYLSRKQAEKLLYKENPTQGERIYSSKGLSCTLMANLRKNKEALLHCSVFIELKAKSKQKLKTNY